MKTPDQTFSPQLLLTKDNVDQYYSGTKPKQGPPLPPDDLYLKDTGILQKFGNVPGLS
jgi:ribose transport system substrate-binding protein